MYFEENHTSGIFGAIKKEELRHHDMCDKSFSHIGTYM